jgi:hypothetical protein
MKARLLTAALACLVVVLPSPSVDAMVASQLYRSCRAPKDSSSYTYCRAYIAGFFGGYVVGMDVSSPNEFCPDPGLTTEQIWKTVEPFLKPRRGQLVDEVAAGVLESALFKAYRCKQGSSSSSKRADTRSKSELHVACQAPKKSSSHTFCRAYLEGHFDGFSAGLEGMTPMRFCPPGDLTGEQIWAKVEPSLKPREGQVGDEAAETALAEALFSAYPCEPN